MRKFLLQQLSEDGVFTEYSEIIKYPDRRNIFFLDLDSTRFPSEKAPSDWFRFLRSRIPSFEFNDTVVNLCHSGMKYEYFLNANNHPRVT